MATVPSSTQLAPLSNPLNLPPVAAPADQQPARVYLATLAGGSHRAMRSALELTADLLSAGACDAWSLPWPQLRYQHLAALRAWLAEHRSASTANKTLSAVRGVLKTAWRMGQMETDDYMRTKDVRNVEEARPDAAAGRALSTGELSALLEVCADDPTPAGPRDAAILGLGVLAGLRRAEIVNLQIQDYDSEKAVLWVRGKRNRVRTVPLALGLADAIEDWLHERGRAAGPLFTRILKSGAVKPNGLSTVAIYRIVEKRSQQAYVKPFTPHDMRRTFAGSLLDAGADIVTVQKLMGHASANTTAGYDRRGERVKRSAIDRLHMPWKKRFSEE